ncbi:hypothetical protein JKP88DRAFT_179449, partial [Tribonema minus]
KLRMLNLQKNCISDIDNLPALPNLIFLDLYSSGIRDLADSARALARTPSLRVLMLGKNRLTALSIAALNTLVKLDTLDLHSNAIATVSGCCLSALGGLRVLNLAGNRLRRVEGLSGLRSLTELNLGRNFITTVSRELELPRLQRLFLSHNLIDSWDECAGLFSATVSASLVELSFNGNPIATQVQMLILLPYAVVYDLVESGTWI